MCTDIRIKYQGESDQTIINKIRYKYASMEEAYLSETDNLPKNCLYCKATAIFISIFKGYTTHCTNPVCVQSHIAQGHKKTALANTTIETFSTKCFVCHEPCGETKATKRNKNRFAICSSAFCIANKYSPFLRETHIIADFKIGDFSYLNQLTYRLMAQYKSKKKVNRILAKNFLLHKEQDFTKYTKNIAVKPLLTDNFDTDKFSLTQDGKYYVSNANKQRINTVKLLYNGHYENLVYEHYPECISTCVICKSKYIYKDIFGKELSSITTCSLVCYYKNFNYYVTEDRRKAQSISMRKAIAIGKFTPNIHNSRTSKNIELHTSNGCLKFRSTWELIYYVMSSSQLEYETIRLPYNINNNTKIYLVDFVDHTNKQLIEIKPSCHTESDVNVAKANVAKLWCEQHGYTYNLVDEKFLTDITSEQFADQLLSKNYQVNTNLTIKIQKTLNGSCKNQSNQENRK